MSFEDRAKVSEQHLAALDKEFADAIVRCAAIGSHRMRSIILVAEHLGHVSKLNINAERRLGPPPDGSRSRRREGQ